MNEVNEVLSSVGGSPQADVDAAAVELSNMMAGITRQLIEEFIEVPVPAFEGKTVRQMIQEGRAREVAAGWRALNEGVFV